MEEGKTYRFARPGLDAHYGEWVAARIKGDLVYNDKGTLMCYTRDFNSADSHGGVVEVNTGPEIYEEWFK